jgi:hypothetical protein
MGRLVLLVLLVTSAAHAQPADSVAWGLPPWWSADEQTRFLSDEATAAGRFALGPLATTPLPEGVREVRIRKASSAFQPLFALRIVDDRGSVIDDGWLWWGADGDSALVPFMSSRCADTQSGPERTVCTGRRIAHADTLLASLHRLGVWTLSGDRPDPPPPPGTLAIRGDGETFVVEVRDGARYRAYTYWSPNRAQEPHEAAAAEVVEMAERRAWSMTAP